MKTLFELSQHAARVDHITLILLILSVILVVAVWLAIVYFCWRYHESREVDRTNPPRQARKVELGVCTVIFIFGLLTFIWSAKEFYRMYLSPPGAKTIYVIGKQWMWTFHDPEGQDHINRLVVKKGAPVRLVMTSEDVIHSFFIPNLRLKQDVLPGRYTSVWFTPEKSGEFEILCTQYCGLEHSEMRAVLQVVDELEPGQPQTGFATMQKYGCTSCHGDRDASAPTLNGIYGKTVRLGDGREVAVDDAYLRRSILQPNADVVAGFAPVMPTFQGQISEKDLADILNYIRTRGDQ